MTSIWICHSRGNPLLGSAGYGPAKADCAFRPSPRALLLCLVRLLGDTLSAAVLLGQACVVRGQRGGLPMRSTRPMRGLVKDDVLSSECRAQKRVSGSLRVCGRVGTQWPAHSTGEARPPRWSRKAHPAHTLGWPRQTNLAEPAESNSRAAPASLAQRSGVCERSVTRSLRSQSNSSAAMLTLPQRAISTPVECWPIKNVIVSCALSADHINRTTTRVLSRMLLSKAEPRSNLVKTALLLAPSSDSMNQTSSRSDT